VIRIAVVGYGYWGPRLTRNFSKVAGCEVAAGRGLDEGLWRLMTWWRGQSRRPALSPAGERRAGA